MRVIALPRHHYSVCALCACFVRVFMCLYVFVCLRVPDVLTVSLMRACVRLCVCVYVCVILCVFLCIRVFVRVYVC